MRHLPKYTYSGLTIVLSNPSRYDIRQHTLLSAQAGLFFEEECLQPFCNKYQCDIRTSDTIIDGCLPDTKGVLLLGERAFKEWTDPGRYTNYNLNEQRGCKIEHTRLIPEAIFLASFSPQDAVDFGDYETDANPLARESILKYGSGKDTHKDDDEKHKGNTARGNYRFFLRKDTKKLISLITGKYLAPSPSKYILYPPSDEVINILSEANNKTLFLDIETDLDLNVICFGFGFDLSQIYSVPCLDYRYQPAYSNLGAILRSLAIAMIKNEVCVHNSLFDLFILAWKYKIGVGRRIYDTMFAHKRCWPEIEKSLGHSMSHLCHEEYHKDEGVFSLGSQEQMINLLKYNAKDIRGMILVREAIDKHAARIPGLTESIAQGNRSVRPDLIAMLQGIKINIEKRKSFIAENDSRMESFLEIIKLLAGHSILPTSNKQCVKYFHDYLGYPVIKRSIKTDQPSLDAEAMLKLKQKAIDKPDKYDNPIIDLCLAYRGLSTSTGWLRFNTFPKEDRCSTQYGMIETFRKSSSIILKRGPAWGQNLQNPTSHNCEIFEAD